MRISRIYHPHAVAVGEVTALEKHTAHYVTNVLRLQPGAPIHIFNNTGGEYRAEIIDVSKRSCDVSILELIDTSTESPLHIHLGQGLSRGEKMDFTIQKAVELGVTEITPVITERCGVKLNAERQQKRLQHWQGVIISACEQCGRNRLPVIHAPVSLSEWLRTVNTARRFLLHPGEAKAFSDIQPETTISLLIGPEGGLADNEISLAKDHDFQAIHMGPRVLRTETAALAAITQLQTLWGDMR